MTRWRTLILTVALALMAFECGLHAAGTPVQPTDPEHAWLVEAEILADDWSADPALPSIDTPRCERALSQVVLHTATEREWIHEIGLCPMTPDGCSTLAGCSGDGCATGHVQYHHGEWVITLSPGEDATGHAHTVRHETAHVLNWCTTGALDYGHSHDDVWGPQGVVWRQGEP